MKESYCGLCDSCRLGSPGFQEAVARVKGVVDNFQTNWWSHCFPAEEGFSFPEFRKGLEWFLRHTDCPGCKGGRGLEQCPIRRCARERRIDHCYECADVDGCANFDFILREFPDHRTQLRRRRLQNKAREFHSRKPGA